MDDMTGSACTNTSFFRLFNGTEVVCDHPKVPRSMATGMSLKMAVKLALLKTSQITAAQSPMSRPSRFVLAGHSFPLSNAFHRESSLSALLHNVPRLSNSVTPRMKISTLITPTLADHKT